MSEVISVIGSLIGVVIGYVLFARNQEQKEKKKKKEIACSFLPELELNLGLIRLAQEEMDNFRGKSITGCHKVDSAIKLDTI